MKEWFRKKKAWIGIGGVVVLVVLGVLGACQAGYCKDEPKTKIKEKEVKVVRKAPQPERVDVHIDTDTLFEDMESHFNQMWQVFDKTFPRIKITHSSRGPRVDMIETKDTLEILAEFPGVSKENISITIDGNYLILETKAAKEKEDQKENYHLKERRYGASKRVLRLPQNINIDKAESFFENGVLKITFPKKESIQKQPKKIEIK